MYEKRFLYTPKSGSKIFLAKTDPFQPLLALENLTNGSHIIHSHSSCPFFLARASSRREREDGRALLLYFGDLAPNFLAYDRQGEIGFFCDLKLAEEIAKMAEKHGRALQIAVAVETAKEALAIWGQQKEEETLFTAPAPLRGLYRIRASRIDHVCCHRQHDHWASSCSSPITWGDLPGNEAGRKFFVSFVSSLWHGQSEETLCSEEAAKVTEQLGNFCDHLTEEQLAEVTKQLTEEDGLCLPGLLGKLFPEQEAALESIYDDAPPPHWEEKKKSEASQKKKEFVERWRDSLNGSICHAMAVMGCSYHSPMCLDSEVIETHERIVQFLMERYAAKAPLEWTPWGFHQISDIAASRRYPESLPPLFSPKEGEIKKWLVGLAPHQLKDFAAWCSAWDQSHDRTLYATEWHPLYVNIRIITALSHAAPFPRAALGLKPHPSLDDRWVLKCPYALQNDALRLPAAEWEIIDRHMNLLLKMAGLIPA